jgi:hypothetical protein
MAVLEYVKQMASKISVHFLKYWANNEFIELLHIIIYSNNGDLNEMMLPVPNFYFFLVTSSAATV